MSRVLFASTQEHSMPNMIFRAGVLFISGCVTTAKPLTVAEAYTQLATTTLEPRAYGHEDHDWGIVPTTDLRTGTYHAPTPKTVPGAHVVETTQLVQLLQSPTPPILIDVLGGSHLSLPGTVWIGGAGLAGTHTHIGRRLEAKLKALTSDDTSKPIVIFCLSSKCWLSYNAVLRAVQARYTNVAWYRGGVSAWKAAGLPMVLTSSESW